MSSSLKQRLVCYPKPLNYKIFIAICYRDQRGKAGLLKEILDNYVKSIPEVERQTLLVDFTKLEEKEKRKPNKKEKY